MTGLPVGWDEPDWTLAPETLGVPGGGLTAGLCPNCTPRERAAALTQAPGLGLPVANDAVMARATAAPAAAARANGLLAKRGTASIPRGSRRGTPGG